MLPRLEQKNLLKEMVPYQTFTRELSSKKQNSNDITKLKLLKDFLQDDTLHTQPNSNDSHLSHPLMPKLPLHDINLNMNLGKAKTSRKNRQSEAENTKKSLYTEARSIRGKAENEKILDGRQRCSKIKLSLPCPTYTNFRISELLFSHKNKNEPRVRSRVSNFGKMNDIIANNRIY